MTVPTRTSRGRALAVPRPGRIVVARVAGAVPAAGRIGVRRVATAPLQKGSRPTEPQGDRTVGHTGLGSITVADGVVARIASRAVLDVADAGGVAPKVLGLTVPGGHLGVRQTSLDSLPKTTATVDGTTAFVTATVSVRWPASIAGTAEQVRASIRGQVEHMANVTVPEVEVHVDAVTARPPARARVL